MFFLFLISIFISIYLFVYLSIHLSSNPTLSYPILSIYLSICTFLEDTLYTFDNVYKYTDLVQAQDHRQSSGLVAQPNCMSCHCMDG